MQATDKDKMEDQLARTRAELIEKSNEVERLKKQLEVAGTELKTAALALRQIALVLEQFRK